MSVPAPNTLADPRLVRRNSQGYACPNEDCGVRLHTFCVAQRLGNDGRCPDRLDDKPNPCPQCVEPSTFRSSC